MAVFVANFGYKNNLWPVCLSDNALLTLEDPLLWELSASGNEEEFSRECMLRKNVYGKQIVKSSGTLYYGFNRRFIETNGDLWVHWDTKRLWWTNSRHGLTVEPYKGTPGEPYNGPPLVLIKRNAAPWSCQNRKGASLELGSIHSKGVDYLSTPNGSAPKEGEIANYVTALINGDNLSQWHNLSAWKQKQEQAKRDLVQISNAAQAAAYTMVEGAHSTAKYNNGQTVETTKKNKEVKGFEGKAAMQAYIEKLMAERNYKCAVCGIPLWFPGMPDFDADRRYSLDRIDSSKHYEPGNLQVVCWFINRWKGVTTNADMNKLLQWVRSTGPDLAEF